MPPLPLLWPLLLPPPLPLLPPPTSLVAPLLPPLPMPAPRRYRLLPPSQQRGLSKLAYASARPQLPNIPPHCCGCRRCNAALLSVLPPTAPATAFAVPLPPLTCLVQGEWEPSKRKQQLKKGLEGGGQQAAPGHTAVATKQATPMACGQSCKCNNPSINSQHSRRCKWGQQAEGGEVGMAASASCTR